MSVRFLLIAGACALACVPVAAQVRVRAGIGPVGSTALVTDSILEPITSRPAMALAFTVELDGQLDSTYRAGLSVTVGRSTLRSHAPSGTTGIVPVTVWQPTVRLARFFGPVETGLRLGLQAYRASRPEGVFRDGGTVTPTVGLDVGWRGVRVGGARIGVTADWMVSRFSTTTLTLSGFSGEQVVHRLGVRATVAGGGGA